MFVGLMMIRVLCCAAVAAASLSSAQASTYSSYFAFGDSLSDDGKGLTALAPVPYSGGRFSTGPVWTEYLSDLFEGRGLQTENYAVGGATAGNVNASDPDYIAFDAVNPDPNAPDVFNLGTFQRQIGVFTPIANAAALGDNPLVSVLFGSNDIFQGQNPVQAATDVLAGIRSINAIDPTRLDSFLVSNLPDFGSTPSFLGSAQASAASGAFNATLEAGLQSLEALGIEVIRLDQDSFLDGILADPAALGLTNTTEACVQPSDASTNFPGANCTIVGFDASGNPIYQADLAEGYLFLDDVHPNGTVQAAFAQEAIASLGTSLTPVPVPAGLPLLMSGIALFAFAHRRKKH